MKKNYLLFCLLLPFSLFAQTFNGTVLEGNSENPVAYANIGIVGKNVGTVTSSTGEFILKFEAETYLDDTLRVSMIGYEPYQITVKSFVEKCTNDCTISLKKANYELQEVVVVPKDFVTKRVGNTVKNDMMSMGYKGNHKGYELGTIMKIRKRPTFVEELRIHIASCEYDSVFYRINIYDTKKGKPHKNILTQPIYFSYAKEDIEEAFVIDLRAHNIYVENDFLVSLELVKDLGEGDLYLKTQLFGAGSYFRETSQGDWLKVPLGMSISALVKQEK